MSIKILASVKKSLNHLLVFFDSGLRIRHYMPIMTHLAEYFLTTKRLGFCTWAKDDFDLAFKLWGDFKVTELIDARGKLSRAQVQERLMQEIATAASHGVQYWPIFLRMNGEFVGCCGVRPYDIPKNIYEIGFHICSKHWAHGFAPEAARGVMGYAFDKLAASGLFAGHNPKNKTSRHLLEKLGFRYTHDEFYPPTGLEHPSYMLTAGEHSREKEATLQIRKTTIADIPTLSSLIRAAYRDVAERFGLTAENCPKHPSNCTDDWIKNDFDRGVEFYILEQIGSPVGCAALEIAGSGICYLERVSVLPEHRNKGYGRALVDHIMVEAKGRGQKTMSIGIIAAQKELKQWYAGIGFVEGETKEFEHLPFQVTFMSYAL
jgi:RimJ/RimL family protein N-acetyltransferase/GNAT superfamily N-acetyltransferase